MWARIYDNVLTKNICDPGGRATRKDQLISAAIGRADHASSQNRIVRLKSVPDTERPMRREGSQGTIRGRVCIAMDGNDTAIHRAQTSNGAAFPFHRIAKRAYESRLSDRGVAAPKKIEGSHAHADSDGNYKRRSYTSESR